MDFCEPRSHVLDGSQVLPVEGRIWGGEHLSTHYRLWEYPTCSQYSQPYSVGGSSDVAFCSNLLVMLLAVELVAGLEQEMFNFSMYGII